MVTGPVTSTQDAIVRWDSIDGTQVADSLVTIDDAGNIQIDGAALIADSPLEMAWSDWVGLTSPVQLDVICDDGAGAQAHMTVAPDDIDFGAGDISDPTTIELIQLVKGVGITIGSRADGKIGFWGTAPISKPSSTGQTTGYTGGAGGAVLAGSTFTGGSGTKAYTIGDIVKHLKAEGLLTAS